MLGWAILLSWVATLLLAALLATLAGFAGAASATLEIVKLLLAGGILVAVFAAATRLVESILFAASEPEATDARVVQISRRAMPRRAE